jgi:hypothetical protein
MPIETEIEQITPTIQVILTLGGAGIQVLDSRPEPKTQEEFIQRAQEHDVAIQDALDKYNAGTITTINQ